MTTKELKIEINKIIEDIPESDLKEILNYLQIVKNISSEDLKLKGFLSKALREDRDLLTRLAE